MRKVLTFVLTLSLATVLSAQNQGFVSVPLSTEGFQNRHITEFEKANYQGMDCWRNYIVSLQHTGIATVWKYDGKDGLEKLGGFNLATHDPVNHSNVCSFGVEKAAPGDPMPVIYVSQCHKKPYQGRKDVLFVERVLPGFQGSELVQTIHFDDVDGLFGYALQWVVDREHRLLYGFGNTTGDKDLEHNKHRVIKFRLPKLSEGDVVFTKADILETYTMEAHGLSYATIGQGLCIWKNKLLMPTGLGTDKYPSYLFVWDLKKKQPVEVLDMSLGTTGELEDLAHFRCNRYLVQGQDGLFELKYK
jgi:hypothetical protein